jgi:hypothetical protein
MVVALVTIDVFDGELGLPDATHAREPRGPKAHGVFFLQDGMKRFEVVETTNEAEVSGNGTMKMTGPP